jgi:hypothetical protein
VEHPQAPHCLIVSQLSERETREWATEFEQFVASLRSRLNIEDPHLAPLTVVLFSSPERFEEYQPHTADGRHNEVAGYCASRDTWAVIGLGKRFGDDEATRRTILHEATHWLTAAARTRLPVWLNEGFAESFETFRIEKDGGYAGDPILEHIEHLKVATWVPLSKLILTSTGDKLYTDTERKRLFYAQSWLFVHRILFQPECNGIEQLNRFFVARLRGADQFTAFKAAFGEDMDAVDRVCRDYARSGLFRYMRFPLPPEVRITAPFTPATPYAVEIALARLAVGTRNEPLARKHTGQALALDPAAPAAYELVASLGSTLGQHDAAAAAARQALDRGSRDGLMHLLLANSLRRLHADRGTIPETSREIADHYAAAIALQPKFRNAYMNLAQIARFLPVPTAADAELLVTGFKLFPDAPELLIGLAAIVHKDGNDTRAFELLDLALSRDELIDDNERATAERLRTEWKIAPLAARVAELEKAKRYAEALAAAEQVLQTPMQVRDRDRWENRRDDLRFRAALAQARQTSKSGNDAGAITQLEALLAQPGLTDRQRNTAQQQLDRTRNLLSTAPAVK